MSEPVRLRSPGQQRATRQAAAVDAALAGADGFLTAHELHDALRRRRADVGMTTVYRHLNRLAEAGRVDVVIRPDGESSYRLCGPAAQSDPEAGHHHHLVCRVCGRSVEVEGPEVEAWAEQVAEAAGYRDVSHTVEIFGVCGRHRPGTRGA
jgi:Fur family ferric uptake transcriptional regulator